jgi:Protein of unknown function (DUF2798)
MEGKAKFVFPVLMAGFITFFLTAIVTIVNVGIPQDFLHRWLKSWFVAWPAAAVIAFVFLPHIRRATDWLVALIERAI